MIPIFSVSKNSVTFPGCLLAFPRTFQQLLTALVNDLTQRGYFHKQDQSHDSTLQVSEEIHWSSRWLGQLTAPKSWAAIRTEFVCGRTSLTEHHPFFIYQLPGVDVLETRGGGNSGSLYNFGEPGFAVAGLTVWNSLPSDIRDIIDSAIFKRHLKTHLFNLYFNMQ